MKIIAFLFSLILSFSSFAVLKEDCKNRKITAYTKEKCSFCIRLKNLLSSVEKEFEEIEITGNKILLSWLISSTNQYTVPYVFIDDKYVGGYSDFVKLCKK
jgi:glutaredoxin 3